MEILLLLVGTILFCWLFQHPIRKAPWVFYLLAIALDILLLVNTYLSLPRWLMHITSVLMQKGGLGVAMFVLVMWIGVFPRNGRLSKTFRPIRAELSIIACILIAGHMVLYLSAYLPRILSGATVKPFVLSSFIIACILLVLVLVLGLTSFRFVKRHMAAKRWKHLQSAAYLFYGLVLVHLLLMLIPSALAGNTRSIEAVIIYGVVFGGYIIARIIRAIVDKREKVNIASTVMDQGFVAES
ncbi:MAG: hypothetical protein IKF96_02005 [Eggerthellaceae bacterium]|nr:hypothetical protein [Eggerthellaceae bacterium]